MAATEIILTGVPGGLTVDVRVRLLTTAAILETVSMTWSTDHYTGNVVGAHEGTFIFEVLISSVPTESKVETIFDDAGPYILAGDLDEANATALAAIKAVVDGNNVNLVSIKATVENTETTVDGIETTVDGIEVTVDDTNAKVTAMDFASINACLAAIKAKTDLIGNVTFLTSTHLPDTKGEIKIKAGDTHAFVFTSDTEDVLPDFTGKTVRFGIKDANGNQLVEDTNVVINSPTGFQSVTVNLLPPVTLALEGVSAFYDVQIEYDANTVHTIFTGPVKTYKDYSGTP